jgi:ketosteroid isomerase-like protein
MSDSDLAAARRAWEAFAGVRQPEEIASLEGCWDPDVAYVEDPKWPGAASFHGYEAVGRRFREYVDDLGADAELVLEDVRDTPEGLVSLVRTRGTSPNGLPFDHLWAYRFRMRDGRVVWFRAYLDPAEALGEAEG